MTTPTKPEMKLTDEKPILSDLQISQMFQLGHNNTINNQAAAIMITCKKVRDHYESHLATLRTRIQDEIKRLEAEIVIINNEHRLATRTHDRIYLETKRRTQEDKIDALQWVLTQIGGDQ